MTLSQVALSQLVLWGTWSAIETVGIRFLLEAVYSNPIKSIQLKRPPPRTPAADSHWIAARIIIALGYFIYAILQVLRSTEVSAYHEFGVSPCASEKDIKRHFRDLAKLYHPDKVGLAGEVKFLQLHEIYEVISEPVLRFAYDRFGAQVGSWSHLSTSNEFVRKGVYDILHTHVHILFAQALGWFLHLRSYNYSIGMGTLWGLLLQGLLCLVQLKLAISVDPCPYIARVTGLTPYQCSSILVRSFFPSILFLQQMNGCLDRLLATGKLGHFQFASSDKPILMESPAELRKSEITRVLRKGAENLPEANAQIDLLTISALQLQAKIYDDVSQNTQDSHS